MGARKIREEIDAMEVLGIDPIERLVVPRVLATVFVALMINGIVIATGIGGGYFFTVIVQHGSAGAFLSSFTALASLPDLYISMIKASEQQIELTIADNGPGLPENFEKPRPAVRRSGIWVSRSVSLFRPPGPFFLL